MRSLWAPLGLLGAAGGWFGAALAGHPWIELAPRVFQPVSAIALALFAASLGRRLQAARPDDGPDRQAKALILLTTLAGAALGWLQQPPTAARAAFGALFGVGCGLLLLPLATLVVAAARRAWAARPASIAARVATWETWMLAASAGAVTTLGAAWKRRDFSHRWAYEEHLATLVIPTVAALAAALLLAGSVIMLWRVRRACRGWARMESWDGDVATADGDSVDLGLGDGVRGLVDRTHAYRDRGRPLWLVIGDPVATRAALRDVVGRSLVALLTALLVLCAHLAAAKALG